MIAIAESGSTKCDWVLLDECNKPQYRFKTIGFNPYFHSADFVSETLNQIGHLSDIKDTVRAVYFYGAGCTSEHLRDRIQQGLKKVFGKASIEVDHDLVAAAYSLYEGEPIISCIMGTGSNSCFFDGDKVVEGVNALGFILGDEGGGSFFGKQLLTDYFYGHLPKEIHHNFSEKYQLEWSEVVPKIYNNANANVYLASFMPFIASFKEHSYVQEMLSKGFGQFIDIHVTKFAEFEKYKVGFVGTIAHIFHDILEQELSKRDCRRGPIVRSPIDRLIAYHVNQLGMISV